MNIQILKGDQFYLWSNKDGKKLIYVIRNGILYHATSLEVEQLDNGKYQYIDYGDYRLVCSGFAREDFKKHGFFTNNQFRKLPYPEVVLMDV